jgi:hypothetical protein
VEYTALDVCILRLGVRVSLGRAYHPQSQGREERFHRTLQAEVLARGGWTDCPQVQRAFDEGRPVYNMQRPHEALALAVPLSRYRPSPRSFPETLPPVAYADGVEVRRADVKGCISYRNREWKVGRAFAGQPVGLRPTATDGVLFLTRLIKESTSAKISARPRPLTSPVPNVSTMSLIHTLRRRCSTLLHGRRRSIAAIYGHGYGSPKSARSTCDVLRRPSKVSALGWCRSGASDFADGAGPGRSREPLAARWSPGCA